MKLIEPTNFHIVDQPIDAIDVIRKKTICGDVDDEAFYVCNVSDIIEKYRNWQKHMPRIIPFYGKCDHYDFTHSFLISIPDKAV